MPDGGIITGVAFRLDETEGVPVTVRLEATEIRMSTSPLKPSTASDRFSDNVGPDETIVFPIGSIDIQAAGSAVVPYPFEIVVPFETPFYYHPRHGSLALDLRNLREGSPVLIDATSVGSVAIAAGLPDPVARNIFL